MAKRDAHPVGYLGRMTDNDYHKLAEKHSVCSHRKRTLERDKIRRLSNAEYIKLKEET